MVVMSKSSCLSNYNVIWGRTGESSLQTSKHSATTLEEFEGVLHHLDRDIHVPSFHSSAILGDFNMDDFNMDVLKTIDHLWLIL